MSSDFDQRLDKAIEKHGERADHEAERLRRSDIAKRALEQQQTDFLVSFSTVGNNVIEPPLRRVEEKLERAHQVGPTRSDEIAALRRVALARVATSKEGQIALLISRPDAGEANLSFRADPQLLKVVVQSNFGAIGPQQLDLPQVTTAYMEALVADFVEKALG